MSPNGKEAALDEIIQEGASQRRKSHRGRRSKRNSRGGHDNVQPAILPSSHSQSRTAETTNVARKVQQKDVQHRWSNSSLNYNGRAPEESKKGLPKFGKKSTYASNTSVAPSPSYRPVKGPGFVQFINSPSSHRPPIGPGKRQASSQATSTPKKTKFKVTMTPDPRASTPTPRSASYIKTEPEDVSIPRHDSREHISDTEVESIEQTMMQMMKDLSAKTGKDVVCCAGVLHDTSSHVLPDETAPLPIRERPNINPRSSSLRVENEPEPSIGTRIGIPKLDEFPKDGFFATAARAFLAGKLPWEMDEDEEHDQAGPDVSQSQPLKTRESRSQRTEKGSGDTVYDVYSPISDFRDKYVYMIHKDLQHDAAMRKREGNAPSPEMAPETTDMRSYSSVLKDLVLSPESYRSDKDEFPISASAKPTAGDENKKPMSLLSSDISMIANKEKIPEADGKDIFEEGRRDSGYDTRRNSVYDTHPQQGLGYSFDRRKSRSSVDQNHSPIGGGGKATMTEEGNRIERKEVERDLMDDVLKAPLIPFPFPHTPLSGSGPKGKRDEGVCTKGRCDSDVMSGRYGGEDWVWP